MGPLLFVVFVGLVAAEPEKNIQNTILTESYSMLPTLTDQGEGRMGVLRKYQEQHARNLAQCYNDGTCPTMYGRDSEGPSDCIDGFAGDFPCRNVDILSLTSIEDLGYFDPLPTDVLPETNDLWGWTDPLNGDEYALVGLTGGTSFVRINDPENPEVLAFLYSTPGTVAVVWRDIKIIQNTAYIGADTRDHGIQVVDLTRLRGRTREQFEFIEPDFHYDGIGASHNIVANVETQFIYAVGGSRTTGCLAGLHMIDVSDRLNPQFVGCYEEDGYVHDAQCVVYTGPDSRYQGNEICFCYNEDSFTIVDVTDKQNPVMLGKEGYIGAEYVHQGWINDAQTIAISNDELDEFFSGDDSNTRTLVWDITNLEQPELKTVFESTETSIDHNIYILGDLVFQSNYEAGLRITHLTEEDFTLREVGYLDVLPERTTVEFEGTWSNYPYFESGNVLVSSKQYGLFIVRPDYDAIAEEIESFSK